MMRKTNGLTLVTGPSCIVSSAIVVVVMSDHSDSSD